MHIGIWVKQFSPFNISDKKAHTNYTREHSMDINFIKQKTRKALRDPKWAIKRTLTLCKDIYTRKKIKYRKYLPIKYSGHYEYTVVSAVYNVEKYLDEYFDSLVSQTLDFKKHIQLILVDDGSTDSSAAIIKKWQEKYPDNIHYYYKENGGQASARNLGLQHVKTEWVTFIDPDDFVSADYFQNVDLFISKNTDLSLVSCNFIFYFEDTYSFKDSHPLRYRFVKDNTKFLISDLQHHIQLSVNSAFFKILEIKENNILFDEKLKPNFEDAKFVGDYCILANQKSTVGFVKDSQYFYRKRSDGTSTLDGAWKKKGLYSEVLSRGCLDLLIQAADKLGYVPKYLQRTVLYHLIWYFKYIVNNNSAVAMLDNDEKENFLSLLNKIFTYIDNKTILEFNLGGAWFFHKVALLGRFKEANPDIQIAYIENIDREKKQFLIYYFSYLDSYEKISINNKDVIPVFKKITQYDFLDKPFVYENRLWISYEGFDEDDLFKFFINNKQAKITLFKKVYPENLKLKDILNKFESLKYKQSENIWIIMDRDTQADDNGEHLYRYIAKNHPEQSIYFALNRSSHDWERLEKDHFNLLDFGSEQFENVLYKANKLISSHLDKYINDYFNDQFGYSKKFIFLQHGITMNDLSAWVNSKINLQCFIMTTQDEYNAIAENYNRYKITKKEAVLTGFPRHDLLLKNNNLDAKNILIMPTWRNSVIGKSDIGNKRLLNDNFMSTKYATYWYNLLHSTQLKDLSEKYGYTVTFAPHANIEPYLEQFSLPKYIKIWHAHNSSIQNLFQNSTFMITDYSSVHFEMAVLNKPVLYYQFDKDDFFNGGHVFQPGYFSYERHGFGPVVYEQDALLMELEAILRSDGQVAEPYKTRIIQTFPFRDGNNSERVYQAIKALDQSDSHCLDIEILFDYVKSAYKQQDWETLKSRSQLLVEYGDEEQKAYAKKCQLAIFLKDKTDNSLLSSNILDDIHSLCIEQYKTDQDILLFYAQALVEYRHWNKLLELSDLLDDDKVKTYYLVLAYYYLGNVKKAHEIYAKPDDESEYKYWRLILELALAINDDELKTYCLNGMIRLYPEESIQENIHILCNLLIK